MKRYLSEQIGTPVDKPLDGLLVDHEVDAYIDLKTACGQLHHILNVREVL